MAARVRALTEDAVRRRLPEAPPYACALSGGFDSSSVAGLARRVLDARGERAPLETFSFELRDAEADEPALIEAVARAVRARHHHVYLDRDDVFEVLPAILRAGGEPTRDMGLLYLWRKKERAAAEGAQVVLSGLGGDELFCGRFQYFADLLRAFRLGALWREVQGICPMDPSTGKPTSRADVLSRYAIAPLVPRSVKRLARRHLLREGAVPPWIAPGLARRTGLAERLREGAPRLYADAYRQDCWEVFHYVLVHLTLPVHEALGAELGVETRFPLLDRRLVEYMFAVPREQKVRHGQTRVLQRRAMAGVLPDEVLREHLKKNLHPVLWRQQRSHFERELGQVLARPRPLSADYLDWGRLRGVYDGYRAGRTAMGYVLWYALNLERWLEGLVRPAARSAA
jgi:asparagine synthase (glutamine-hydrolysing)